MPAFKALVAAPAGSPGPARPRWQRVQAADAAAVPQALGLHPARVLQVRPAGAALGGPAARGPALDLRLFSQALALLLQSGIPLLEALQTLRERDASNRFADSDALGPVIAALRQGQPVSAALAAQPGVFDPLFVAMVAAGERSGQLADTLAQHAQYLAWRDALQARLRAALVYPLMLLGAGFAVVMFLLLFVLPRFAGVFDGLGPDIPAASRALITLGQAASARPAVAWALALAGPALLAAGWHWPPLRAAAAAALWRSPGLGPRLRTVALARLYRSLGLLLGAGVPVTQALRLLDGVLAAPLRPALAQVLVQVGQGRRLSQAMDAQGLATPVAQSMLRVGERSGALATMLERAARFHDEETQRLSELVARSITPALMLVMGVLIGGIVVLMYLPIFTLMEHVQ